MNFLTLGVSNGSGSAGFCPDTPLSLLTRGFLELLMASADQVVDIEEVAVSLLTSTRRVYNIVSVLRGLSMVQRTGTRVKWV